MASFEDLEQDISAWGQPGSTAKPNSSNTVHDVVRKEQVIKELLAGQGDLKALVDKVKSTQADVDKMTADNATLHLYIDNLTKQIAQP